MPTPFSRTLRSVESDRSCRHTIGLLTSTALLSIWFAWFLFGRVAVYEVTDRAHLEVEVASHPVAAEVGGRVVRTVLRLGKEVRAGEILVQLDAEAERFALDEAKARLAGLRAQIQALTLEIQAKKEGIEAHRKESTTALEESWARMVEAKARARFAEQQLKAREALRHGNLVSEENLKQVQAEAESGRAEVEALRLLRVRLEKEYALKSIDRQAHIAKLERTLADLTADAAMREVSIRRIEHELEQHLIRAPIDGRVAQAGKLRVGSVLQTAEVLGSIVPQGKVRAVAFFPVATVGRVRAGQPARLRLDGYPWTQYGTLAATVVALGNEPIDGRVRVELVLVVASAPAIPLGHGLSGTAEVEIERASPAELVLRTVGKRLTTMQSQLPAPVVEGVP
jgi:multidrug resistance efflux pump